MTHDEARALFDAAIDDELDPKTREAFFALIEANDALREEFTRHRDVIAATRALAREAPRVNILKGVQAKLRERSGGRFYRDRFAEQHGRSPQIVWMLVLSALVLVGFAIFVAVYFIG